MMDKSNKDIEDLRKKIMIYKVSMELQLYHLLILLEYRSYGLGLPLEYYK